MKRSLLSWGIDVLAFCVAALVTPGFLLSTPLVLIVVVGALFASLMAIARPFYWLVVCPLSVLTLVPLTLALNSLFFWLSTVVADSVGATISAVGLAPFVVGAVIGSAVRATLMNGAKAFASWLAFQRRRDEMRRLEDLNRRLDCQLAGWKALAKDWERLRSVELK